ncbi:hypothetical protein [Pseudactinotalea sp. Z1732]|uniref:hypothetical protein n=1 Tax=Micrococcales TaxID=85006 RepID=UPI003C7BF146
MSSNQWGIRTSAVSVAEGIVAKENLEFIAARWPDLRARLRPSRGLDLGTARPAPASRPPINLAVSDLMHEIAVEAEALAHVLMDEADWTPVTSSMPGLLSDVAQRYGHWIAGDDRTALAFIDWAEDYRHKVERTLEKPVPPSYIGPCRLDLCEGSVYYRRGQTVGKCDTCRNTWDLIAQRDLVRRALEVRLMTQSEIVSALTVMDIPRGIKTVNSWVRRGRLTEVSPRLYRFATALDLAQQTPGRNERINT